MSLNAQVVRSTCDPASMAVYDGSMIRSGVATVSQCDTDEPPCTEGGANIRVWPLVLPPPSRKPLPALVKVSFQVRKPLLTAAAARCELLSEGSASEVFSSNSE